MQYTPPLLSAEAFLNGREGIKPLQHKAEKLQAFVRGFDGIALAEEAAGRLVQVSEHMQQAGWPEAHDAAYEAMRSTQRGLNSAHADKDIKQAVEALFRSAAPGAESVKDGLTRGTLPKTLEPFAHYLERFAPVPGVLSLLRPQDMRPKEGEGITPPAYAEQKAARRAMEQAAHVCEDPTCTVPHAAVPGNAVSASHVHGPGCGHALPAAKGSPLVWWGLAAGAAAVVAAFAYTYGRGPKPNSRTEERDGASRTPLAVEEAPHMGLEG